MVQSVLSRFPSIAKPSLPSLRTTTAGRLKPYHTAILPLRRPALPPAPHPATLLQSRASHGSVKPSLDNSPRSSTPGSTPINRAISYALDHESLSVQLEPGRTSKFHHIWLRDNCRCEKCFFPATKQRLLDTYQIPLDIQPHRVDLKEDGFSIIWPDGHSSFIRLSFLWQYSYDPPLPYPPTPAHPHHRKKKQLWDHTLGSCMPSVSYRDIFSSDELTWKGDFYVLQWLRKIEKYGFCLVDDVPPCPEATRDLLKRISFIRETHYGSFWNFEADLKHGDTAYTHLALGAHTDNTYFSDPAGLQLLHLLSPPTSHQGGKTLLVDGFAAAERVKRDCPEAYRVLSETPLDTHASGDEGVAFRPLLPQPVFSHHPRSNELCIIRWNPDDRQPIRGRSGPEIQTIYAAIREWEKIIKSREMELWTQMKTGQALIFDNHRVLHGRSSFVGSRRLCGGYINGDDYRSRLRSLERKLAATSGP